MQLDPLIVMFGMFLMSLNYIIIEYFKNEAKGTRQKKVENSDPSVELSTLFFEGFPYKLDYYFCFVSVEAISHFRKGHPFCSGNIFSIFITPKVFRLMCFLWLVCAAVQNRRICVSVCCC